MSMWLVAPHLYVSCGCLGTEMSACGPHFATRPGYPALQGRNKKLGWCAGTHAYRAPTLGIVVGKAGNNARKFEGNK